MGAVKANLMAMQETVWDYIDGSILCECEHVSELIAKVDNAVPDYIPGDIIASVCNEAWNEFWSDYR